MARSRYSSEEKKTNQEGPEDRPDGVSSPETLQDGLGGPPEFASPDNRLEEDMSSLNARIKETEAELEALKRRHRQMKEEKRRAEAADVGESRVSALKRASDLLAKDTTAAKSADANRMRQLQQQVADLAQKT